MRAWQHPALSSSFATGIDQEAKNVGYWGDLSQLLTSYSRQVLRTDIGDTTLKALSRDLRTLMQAVERIGEPGVGL